MKVFCLKFSNSVVPFKVLHSFILHFSTRLAQHCQKTLVLFYFTFQQFFPKVYCQQRGFNFRRSLGSNLNETITASNPYAFYYGRFICLSFLISLHALKRIFNKFEQFKMHCFIEISQIVKHKRNLITQSNSYYHFSFSRTSVQVIKSSQEASCFDW